MRRFQGLVAINAVVFSGARLVRKHPERFVRQPPGGRRAGRISSGVRGFSRQLSIRRETPSGTSARCSRTGLGRSLRIDDAIASAVSPTNGRAPVAISYSTTPNGALDQFHRDEPNVLGLFDREDGDDVRVVESGNGVGFTCEPRQAIRSIRRAIDQHFDRASRSSLVSRAR
jgi:hypothetical protein